MPAAGGLEVDANGAVSIGNTVSPATHPVITYDANGLATAGRGLTSSDLPSGSGSEVGAVKPGNGLSVRNDGTLDVILPRRCRLAASSRAMESPLLLTARSRSH